MGKDYYRSMQVTLVGESCCMETWHESRGMFKSNRRVSKVTHYASGGTFQESSNDTYKESEAKVQNAASIWISNWLKQQQEANKRRQEEERKRLEAVRKAEQEAYNAKLREQEAIQQREREEQQQEHERQLRLQQLVSLNALKNQKAAERERIRLCELTPLQSKIKAIDEEIETEEKELHKFSREREKTQKTIVLIGMTGDGKSTLGNRLCGDISMMANETGPYKTSHDNQSCTQILQKYMANNLSIIDCPGWGDSGDKDRTHTNNLCAYLRGCGGINAFVVVRNGANCRFDAYFQTQLKYLESVFGDNFWNHLIVVLTRIDKGIAEYQFKNGNKEEEMKQDVSTLCNGLNHNVTVIPIGLDNYQDKLPLFINAIPQQKYECGNLKSPIDALKADKNVHIEQKNQIQQRIDRICNEINTIDAQISNLNQ